jgi:PAS domain S-box-containing protein
MTVKKIPPHLKNTALVTNELLESEKIYRGIFEYCSIPTVVVGEDNTILLANGKFEELSGYPRGEIEAKKQWTEFVCEEDVDKTKKYLAENLKPGGWTPVRYTFGFVDRNRMVRDLSAGMNVIAGTKRTVITLVDITPRKKIERMLRINEERYQSLVKHLRTGVFRMTLRQPGLFIWANPAFLSMLGYGSLAELLKIPASALYADPRDRERIIEDVKTGSFAQYDKIRLRKNDGTTIWASLTAEVKKNDNGKPEWIDGTVDDITQRLHIEEDLQRAHSRFEELLDAVTTYSIFGTDPEGKLTIFNTGSERMLGYKAEDIIGKETPLLFLHAPEVAARANSAPEDAGPVPPGFAAFVSRARTNGCDEQEWTYVRSDRTHIPVDLTMTVMRNENGEITGYLGVAQEISDRKRLEEAFRYDKLQMSGVIYNVPEPTFAIDRTGKVIAWNRAIEELSGVRAVDILGKGNYMYSLPFYEKPQPMLLDLIFHPDTEIRRQGYTAITRKGNSVTAETRIINSSGITLVIRGIAAPIYNDAGDIAGSIETIIDITEEKMRESALLDSESRFRAILDYIGSAIAIIEEDSVISYINPEFERIIGYVREEVEGKKKWTEFVAPEDLERLTEYQRRRRIDPSGVPTRYEFRFIRWDGQIRNGFLTTTLMPESGRTVVSLLDITNKVQADEAIMRANKKLNFFSSITRHDILNLLTSLKGNLELSKESTDITSIRTSVEKELAAAEAIQNEILFTRDYQDIGIQPPAWQNVREVILKSCSGIQLGKVEVEVMIAGAEIYADLLLERVFFHLIDNAIRYGGPVSRIRFSCEESFDKLVFACEDNGIGILADAKERIFNRQHYGSAGLAMFVSREILSITGISICETGTPGKGARFEIRVPKGAYRFVSGES